MSEIITIDTSDKFLTLAPKDMVTKATAIAEVLADVIKKQKLSSNISGKEFVRYEGWNLMGAMLGYLPGEDEVKKLPDGSYEVHVTLYNVHTGLPLGKGASSLCSVKEKRWGSADEFARRSMAITRAAGKAYRISFGWIMSLAGYEPTPAEEMPEEPKVSNPKYRGDANQKALLMAAFNRHQITSIDVMKRLSEEFVGQPMNEIDFFIDAAITEGRAET